MKELLIGILVLIGGIIVVGGLSYGLGYLTNLFAKKKEDDPDGIATDGLLTLLIIIMAGVILVVCYRVGWLILNPV